LHEELKGTGVLVTNLSPGPTETNFSTVARSHYRRKAQAAKMSAAVVAQAGLDGFRRGKAEVIPGIQNRILTRFAAKLIPRGFIRSLVGKYNKLH
jgi:hypothetical protein